MEREINQAGLDMIKSFEGLKLHPYPDSVHVPTIGYGTIMYKDGRKVTLQDPPITEAEATDLLMWEIDQKCAGIEKYVTATINDNQYAALVSFAYNLGLGALHGSTLLKLLNANGPSQAVADQFLKWDHAGGVAVSGLTRRRQAEHALFMQPVVQSDEQPSTEDVDSKLQTLEDDIMK